MRFLVVDAFEPMPTADSVAAMHKRLADKGLKLLGRLDPLAQLLDVNCPANDMKDNIISACYEQLGALSDRVCSTDVFILILCVGCQKADSEVLAALGQRGMQFVRRCLADLCCRQQRSSSGTLSTSFVPMSRGALRFQLCSKPTGLGVSLFLLAVFQSAGLLQLRRRVVRCVRGCRSTSRSCRSEGRCLIFR